MTSLSTMAPSVRLDSFSGPASSPSGRCRLCGGDGMAMRLEAAMLGRHHARLEQCVSCGYAQFASPSWLADAYSEAITATDLGLLQRCIRSARRIRGLLAVAGVARMPVLDWGGGYGTLTRLLRDAGVDCHHWDPHCRNLFASGFEASPGDRRWGAVIALEVVEHLVDPWAFFTEAARVSDLVVFSTELVSEPAPPVGWHYYATEHGQHVGFMSRRSVAVVASRLGMQWTRAGSLHVLTRGRSALRRAALAWSPARRAASAWLRLPSRLGEDYRRAMSLVDGTNLRGT